MTKYSSFSDILGLLSNGNYRILTIENMPSTFSKTLGVKIENVDSFNEIAWNRLKKIEFISCPGLRTFDIPLPPEIVELKVTHCDLETFVLQLPSTQLPSTQLPSTLKSLDLSNNRLTRIPRCIIENSVVKINLANNEFWFHAGSDVPFSKISRDTIDELLRAHKLLLLSTSQINKVLKHYNFENSKIQREILELYEQNRSHRLLPLHFQFQAHHVTAQDWDQTTTQDYHMTTQDWNRVHHAAAHDLNSVYDDRHAPFPRTFLHDDPLPFRLNLHVRTAYEDDQNVHMSGVQRSVAEIVKNVMSLNIRESDDDIDEFAKRLDRAHSSTRSWLWRLVSLFSTRPGRVLKEWCSRPEVHGQLRVSMSQISRRIFGIIERVDEGAREEAYKSIAVEILENRYMCFTGRISHLLNSLSGIVDGFEVKMSRGEALQNAMATVRNKWARVHGLGQGLEGENLDAYLRDVVPDAMQTLEDMCVPEAEQEAWLDAL